METKTQGEQSRNEDSWRTMRKGKLKENNLVTKTQGEQRRNEDSRRTMRNNDPRRMYGIGMKYVRNMYGICTECVWNMYGIGMEYVRNMYGICMESEWNMYGICMEDVWNRYGICVGCSWSMYGICNERVRNIYIYIYILVYMDFSINPLTTFTAKVAMRRRYAPAKIYTF